MVGYAVFKISPKNCASQKRTGLRSKTSDLKNTRVFNSSHELSAYCCAELGCGPRPTATAGARPRRAETRSSEYGHIEPSYFIVRILDELNGGHHGPVNLRHLRANDSKVTLIKVKPTYIPRFHRVRCSFWWQVYEECGMMPICFTERVGFSDRDVLESRKDQIQKKKKKKTCRMCSREPAGAPDKIMTSRALGTVISSEVVHKRACRPSSRVKKETEP
ncbi:hypothetical protein EVAR_25309_1 [Eumeta japonica]|uniref:Uncharacterized protein n=1 Tax=Eumeta variegata TaxID=151549 RepID=A0A4C1VMW3_EUMVA|nr:hypothetical protein EVAR_25309_1 [Eumeta japonica]